MLKKSLIIATGITLTLFGIILYIGTLYAQYNPGTGTQYPPKNLGQGSRDFGYFFHEVGTAATYTEYFGTQSVTGSGTAGRITGTSSALPHVKYAYAGGTPTFNFVGATLQNEGVDVTVDSDLTGYIAVAGGTGTGNVLTNTTLDGAGTVSANIALSGNITANSLEITPTELGYLNNATSEIQSQITTATGSITNHVHSGSDGTTQIAHDSVTGTGTNSHATIDTFVSSKAQASGLASLDGNSLVVQNPASGTTTPTASKILISDGSGKIADGWLNSTVSLLGQTIELGTETTGNTDNVTEGSSNLYYTTARVNSAVGSLSVNALSDVNITFNEGDMVKIIGGQLVAGSLTASVAWAGITGIPTDNGSVSTTSGAGYIPVAGSDGKLDYSWNKDVIRLTGTTTEQAAGAYGQLYVQSSSGSAGVGVGGFGTLTTTSLVSYYRLNDTADSFGANPLTNYNSTTFVAGKYGNCATFNGTTQYLSRGVLSTATTNVSMFGWVYIPDTLQQGMFFSNGAGNGYGVGVGSSHVINGGNDLIIALNAVQIIDTNTTIGTGWHHVGVTRDGTTWRGYIDSVQCATTSTTNPATPSTAFSIGAHGGTDFYNDKIDDVVFYNKCLSAGEIIELYNNTGLGTNYTQYSAKYADPVNGNEKLIIQTPGTATSEPSYVMANVDTLIVGLGTTTAVTGTTTSYKGWFDGAVRATAFNVASSEKIKDNLKKIKIVDTVEAENTAKSGYINSNKPAWIAANTASYTYVGSDTATYIDTTAMNTAYNNYINLAWAADLNQPVYIKNVEKEYEKGFWQKFSKVQPKSWNPKGDSSLIRKGFVVEEMPDEVKGQDKQSIDPMALIAYIAVSMQSIKQDNVTIMQALRDFAATGTFTVQAIEDRLDVLEPAP